MFETFFNYTNQKTVEKKSALQFPGRWSHKQRIFEQQVFNDLYGRDIIEEYIKVTSKYSFYFVLDDGRRTESSSAINTDANNGLQWQFAHCQQKVAASLFC